MKPLPHRYEADLTGGPSGCALTSAPNVPALCVTQPLEFDGPGDHWTPEHLLLASVEACLLLTFRARARHAQLPFESVRVHATGTVDRVQGATRFTEIDLAIRPKTGMALFWYNLLADGTPDPRTRHCGEPVTSGFKVIVTKWFRVHGDGPVLYD